MIFLTILFQLRFSETSAVPPFTYAFNITGNTDSELKTKYLEGIAAMKKQFPKYKHITRLAVLEDKTSEMRVKYPDWVLAQLETV